MSRSRTKHLLMNAAKWLLSFAAFYYVLREIDIHQLSSMITTQQPVYLVVAVALLLLQAIISTLRWKKIIGILTPAMAQMPFRPLFVMNYISMFFNNCLPGTIGGDIIRVLMLKSPAINVSTAAYGVVIDRLMAVIGIVLMVALSLPWLAPLMGWAHGEVLAALIVFCILSTVKVARFAQLCVSKMPENRLMHMLSHFLQHLLRAVSNPLHYGIMLGQAAAAHITFCAAVYMIAQSIAIPLSFVDCLLLIPLMLLISMIPVSVGGWGVREVTMVYLLGLVGVEKAPALLISIQLGILMMAASLPAVILWLKRKGTQHE